MKHPSSLAALAATVLVVTLTAAPGAAQAPLALKAGVGVEAALGSDRRAKLTLSPRPKRLVRVLIAAIDGSRRPVVAVVQGKKAIKPALSQFQNYTVLEWPAVHAATITMTLKGKKAADRYRVKYTTPTIPVAKLPASSFDVSVDCALSHTAWARAKLKAKTQYKLQASLDCDGELSTIVRGADGATIRHKTAGRRAEWAAKKGEVVYLEMRADSSACRRVKFSMRSGRRWLPMMLLREESMIQELPPPEPREWPQERVVPVGKGQVAEHWINFEPEDVGKTFVVETVGTKLQDPTLWVQDSDDKLLQWDDDSGDGYNAKIRFKVQAESETFFVRSFQNHLGGEVTLRWQPEQR